MPDVNGSSHHLLLTEQDWSAALTGEDAARDLEWTRATGLRLRRTVPFTRRTSPLRLTAEDRRASDRDRYGTFWVVGQDRRGVWRMDESGSALVWPSATPTDPSLFSACAPEDPPSLGRLGGLVATDDARLVVGLLDLPGLLVLDLVGGAPVVLDWSHAVPDFRPVDCCRRPGGGVLVLDADPRRPEPTRVWRLDHVLEPPTVADVAPEPLVFSDRAAADEGPPGPAEPLRRPVPWVLDVPAARAVEAVDATRYLVLDGSSRVLQFAESTPADVLDLSTALADRLADPAGDGSVTGHDIAVTAAPDGRPVLHVSDAGGREVFAFDVQSGYAALTDEYLLRRHTGRGLVGGDGVWFDTAQRWHRLVPRGRGRHRTRGRLVTAPFDGHEPGCRWHRVAVDGCLPEGTALQVESRAADDPAELEGVPWRLEPPPYLQRGGQRRHDPGRRHERSGTWETLLQRTDGRYCQLRLTLQGTGATSPEIASLRLVYPRFSYLQEYLPQVYAEADRSTRFLERYLANPEGILTELEERIAGAQVLFDARTAPSDYLEWLAAWLGGVLDADLEERRRRLFLTHAAELFARRGTVTGLLAALRLVIGECPEDGLFAAPDEEPFGFRIAERYLSRRLGVRVPSGPMAVPVLDPEAAAPGQGWTAALGAQELHRRFRVHLVGRYGEDWSEGALPAGAWVLGHDPSTVEVSPTSPTDPAELADWTAFLAGQLGVRTVAFEPRHVELYRRFLLQRYRRLERLVEAHPFATAPTSFAEVGPPEHLPALGPALTDWQAFVALVVPVAESAHRFTVLLPVEPTASEQVQRRLLERARRVVEVERPAHTVFDVRPYWAAFQLGDARLGVDTRLGAGARFAALVLDRDRLARGRLPGPPDPRRPCLEPQP